MNQKTSLESLKSEMPSQPASMAMIEAETARAVQEIQASLVIAKKFPRDEQQAVSAILRACERVSLAEEAMYEYPRGGTRVTGPSIRLAEAMAQAWGNIQFGIRELSQTPGMSEVEAFAWDLQTNTRRTMVFQVPHSRKSRDKVEYLTDPRDIYEMVANQGSRRVRACILAVIPGDVQDAAIARCERTLAKGDGRPLGERIKDCIEAFSKIGVTAAMIERRLQHDVHVMSETELISLRKVYKSISDGMSAKEEFFPAEGVSVNRPAPKEAAPAAQPEAAAPAPQQPDEQPTGEPEQSAPAPQAAPTRRRGRSIE